MNAYLGKVYSNHSCEPPTFSPILHPLAFTTAIGQMVVGNIPTIVNDYMSALT
jgi:hypothetical protein